MYELLTTRWGMGHSLAVTPIDHYGGNIYDIFQQLQFLNGKGNALLEYVKDRLTLSKGA